MQASRAWMWTCARLSVHRQARCLLVLLRVCGHPVPVRGGFLCRGLVADGGWKHGEGARHRWLVSACHRRRSWSKSSRCGPPVRQGAMEACCSAALSRVHSNNERQTMWWLTKRLGLGQRLPRWPCARCAVRMRSQQTPVARGASSSRSCSPVSEGGWRRSGEEKV